MRASSVNSSLPASISAAAPARSAATRSAPLAWTSTGRSAAQGWVRSAPHSAAPSMSGRPAPTSTICGWISRAMRNASAAELAVETS